MSSYYPAHIQTDEQKAAYDKETKEMYARVHLENRMRLEALRAKHENDPYVEGIPVDLSRGLSGVCERFGHKWYTSVKPLGGGVYEVRIESGWYNDYDRYGTSINSSDHITFFAPCERFSPQARDLPSETNP